MNLIRCLLLFSPYSLPHALDLRWAQWNRAFSPAGSFFFCQGQGIEPDSLANSAASLFSLRSASCVATVFDEGYTKACGYCG